MLGLRNDLVNVGAINNISFVFPPFSPLTQPESVDSSTMFCDEDNIPKRCNGLAICPCTHRLRVKKNAIVELVVVDVTPGKFPNISGIPF
jgi:hypothetical protein